MSMQLMRKIDLESQLNVKAPDTQMTSYTRKLKRVYLNRLGGGHDTSVAQANCQ